MSDAPRAVADTDADADVAAVAADGGAEAVKETTETAPSMVVHSESVKESTETMTAGVPSSSSVPSESIKETTETGTETAPPTVVHSESVKESTETMTAGVPSPSVVHSESVKETTETMTAGVPSPSIVHSESVKEATTTTTETATPMVVQNNSVSEDAVPDSAKGLRVRVDFRIGQIELPLQELLRLAEGQTLQKLDGIRFPRVEAVSAGRVFAEGELVEVGGRIGFRILRLVR
ncbi:MAG: FliM/FliN family flagellar motor switch protein [Alphaproteobacteria bacterium]|nr:FliM/FliN family flagellar motor switch protein [Alphaproteobacteria bacterium]MDA8005546.1 FliM/FliN family flagellar motor switch protein [Alphaproteobacteria bacterium]MDA8012709.1 FliM/FliN family flagellar motor switch protein [Alphaproteobacteria bacterium]